MMEIPDRLVLGPGIVQSNSDDVTSWKNEDSIPDRNKRIASSPKSQFDSGFHQVSFPVGVTVGLNSTTRCINSLCSNAGYMQTTNIHWQKVCQKCSY